MSPEQLNEILEAHRKWVDSEGKEGGKASLIGANLQGASLIGANLQEASLGGANLQRSNLIGANLQEANLIGANLQGASIFIAKGLTVSQVMAAKNWELAFYSDNLLEELGLRPHHNETVKKKLAKLEKKKEGSSYQEVTKWQRHPSAGSFPLLAYSPFSSATGWLSGHPPIISVGLF